MRRIGVEETKSLPIKAAYKKVKSKGSSGVDKVSLEGFQADLGNNLGFTENLIEVLFLVGS